MKANVYWSFSNKMVPVYARHFSKDSTNIKLSNFHNNLQSRYFRDTYFMDEKKQNIWE